MSDDLTGFPAPAAPTNPVLSRDEIAFRGSASLPTILDVGSPLFTTSGRAAIAVALQCMGIGPGDDVLIPAYHCPTMVEPVTWTGARARFYRLSPDLALDTDEIDSHITPAVRAVMAVHYFGFVQDLRPLRRLCDERGLLLLEDCAHAFFGGTLEAPVGSVGDYSIASLMKFFPVYDGGCLVSGRHDLSRIHLLRADLTFQVRAAVNMLERSMEFGRLPLLRMALRAPIYVKDLLWSLSRRRSSQGSTPAPAPSPSGGGSEFDPDSVNKSISVFSRRILELAACCHNVSRRRHHYQRLLERFAATPGMRPLYPTLPTGVVPYVFPLLVEAPDPMFRALRREALPLLRWEYLAPEVDADRFPISAHYSRHLVQIPCHQSLTASELDWMVDRLLALNPSQSATI